MGCYSVFAPLLYPTSHFTSATCDFNFFAQRFQCDDRMCKISLVLLQGELELCGMAVNCCCCCKPTFCLAVVKIESCLHCF